MTDGRGDLSIHVEVPQMHAKIYIQKTLHATVVISLIDVLFIVTYLVSVQSSFSLLLHLLGSRAVLASLPPSPNVGQLLLNRGVESLAVVLQNKRQEHVPGEERQVGVGVLVTNKVLGALSLEVLVQNLQHTSDLVAVSFLCRLDLFGVVVGEPGALTVVRALTGDLEVQPVIGVNHLAAGLESDGRDSPLLEEVLLGGRGVGELILLVVCIDQVLDNSTTLPECDSSVGVLDSGCASVDTKPGMES